MEENLKLNTEVIETCEKTPEIYPVQEIDLIKSEDFFFLEDCGEIVVHGTSEQVGMMYDDYSKYFSEVSNPWNTMTNTFLKNKYAPLNEVLNAVRPTLGKYGLSVMQSPKIDEKGDVNVQTVLLHKSGATMVFPSLKSKAVKGDIQGIGAAITYLRRFSASSILGIASEDDDDGESNSQEKKKQSKPKVPESKARADVLNYIKENNLVMADIAKEFGLTKDTTDEVYVSTLEALKARA